MSRALWLTQMLIISASIGCSSTPTPPPDLLNDLRANERALGNDSAGTRGKTPSIPTPTQEEPRELDEVKIITPAMLEGDYPSATYITGVGYTEELNLNQAMLNAKEQVAASISSQIQSVLTVILTADETRASNSSEQRQETTQRVTFDRAELIKIDTRRTGCDDERCVAVAYLMRSVLARDPLDDFKPLSAQFKRAAEDCIELASKRQVSLFAERFAALERAYVKLKPIAAQLQAILGAERFQDWRAVQRLRRQVADERDELNATAPIVLDVSGIEPASLGAVISEVHREDLGVIGAQTRPALDAVSPCQGQPSHALHARLEGQLTHHELLGNQIYKLPYQVTVKTCHDQRVVARFKLSFKFSVPDNSNLEQSALKKMRKTSPDTRRRLYDALHLTLPLNQP